EGFLPYEECDDDIEEKSDNLDGWVDEMAVLSQAKHQDMDHKLHPVKLVLAKLRKLAYKTVFLTTKLLPAWNSCLTDLNLPFKIIPHDVRTQWNLTYDLLTFLLEHKEAYIWFTGDVKNG
ncbi:hypothetical protein BDQ17DRAFT_1183093, partial [Cyathus striatus]